MHVVSETEVVDLPGESDRMKSEMKSKMKCPSPRGCASDQTWPAGKSLREQLHHDNDSYERFTNTVSTLQPAASIPF